MTSTCAVLSKAKALWLRATGQSGWCRCIVCRDKILNSPDPLHFSEDARKFQKRLRQKAKAYKIRTYFVNRKDLHGKSNSGIYEVPSSKTENPNVSETKPHSVPPTSGIPETPRERDADAEMTQNSASKVEKSVRFADPLHQEYSKDRSDTSTSTSSSSKEEDELKTYFSSDVDKYIDYIGERRIPQKYAKQRQGATIPILSSLRTILENPSPTSVDSAEHDIESSEKIWKDDELDLYEVRPPRKLPQHTAFLYHDDDSMNSYGTITSQELLEAFQKATEENLVASLACFDDNRTACEDDNYLYTDLVYVSSPHKI